MLTNRFMRSILFSCFIVIGNGLGGIASEPRREKDAKSDALLLAVFRAEAVGDLDLREKLVSSLSSSSTDSAQRSLGKLQDRKGEWKSIETCIEEAASDPKLKAYENRRVQRSDSLTEHLEMAKWCQAARLPEQRRAHLNRALRIDPENIYVHQELGNRRIGWDWVSPEQIQNAEARAKRIQTSIHQFGLLMRSVARDLGSEKPSTIERAENRLRSARDPKAIPAMEAAFSKVSERATEAGLDWLSSHSDSDAALALMRFAVFHPSEFVRRIAGDHLSKRDPFEYTPALIELVTSPIQASLEPVYGREGNLLGFRQAFSKEGPEQDRFLVMETAINGVQVSSLPGLPVTQVRGVTPLRGTNAWSTAVDAIDRVQETASQREQRVASRNLQSRMLNLRVSTIVSQIAGREVSPEPKELWGWWYEFNERERPPVRSARYVRLYNESNYEIQASPSQVLSAECFVEGTPVTTQSGLKPIEKIVTGDLVLSKNVRTGQLAWKPVIEATRRPRSSILVIRAGTDELRCTPGHVFWVSGKGWQKASELLPGSILHGAKFPVAIEDIDEAGEAETFNLIVSEHANYFVGRQLILSHDYTSRTYTPEVVPGYAPER